MSWRFLNKKYQDHIPCNFAYKVVCVDDRFTKGIVVYRGENAAYEFIKAILKEYTYCRKVINKNFNKDLITSEIESNKVSSNKVTVLGFVINLLTMMKKK